ncbi:hypothetical protein ACQUQU_02940 [Thalassolituus sp. LLYu03]|uniref:hypothetical protein n=1 Tax=Thalassolituus sp. LLYu03 TaxID=3421656 RepID=UPI003D2804DA
MKSSVALLLALLISPLSQADVKPVAPAEKPEPLVIGAMEKYPLNSLGVNVLREAYDQLKLTFIISEWPSPRSLELADLGKLDAEMGRIDAVESRYSHLRRVPVPLITLDIVAVTSTPELQNVPLNKIGQYHLGITRGMSLYNLMDQPVSAAEQPGTAGQLLRMVVNKRVDFALVPSSVARCWQETVAVPLYVVPDTLASFRIYHYLNRKHENLVQPLTQVLQQMEDSGRLDTIKERFMHSLVQEQASAPDGEKAH